MQSWFETHFMPMETITEAIAQYRALRGGRGNIGFFFYNEPALDPRLPEIVRKAKEIAPSVRTYFDSNADFMTKGLARELNGHVDQIIFALYDRRTRQEKKRQLRSWFPDTSLILKHGHAVTHYNPSGLPAIESPCLTSGKRLLINHKGRYAMCCEDMTGNFGFGFFPEISLAAHWYGDAHAETVRDLRLPGGRRNHPYCAICPREFAA